MFTYIHTYIHTHIHTYTYIYTYIYTSLHLHIAVLYSLGKDHQQTRSVAGGMWYCGTEADWVWFKVGVAVDPLGWQQAVY